MRPPEAFTTESLKATGYLSPFLNDLLATPTARVEQQARASLDEQVRAILAPEGIEAPPIDIKIALVKHETAADGAALCQDIRSSDIYIGERFGASTAHISDLQALSEGTLTPEEKEQRYPSMFPAFQREIDNALYRSKTRVAHIDVKDTDPLYEEGQRVFATVAQQTVRVLRREVPFREACTLTLSSLATFGEYVIRRRNEHMLNNLAPQIAAVIRKNPSLQGPRRPLKVFMWIGAAHHDVATQLEESGSKVSVVRHKTSKNLNHTQDVLEKGTDGIPPTETDGRLVLLETTLGSLYSVTDSTLVPKNPFIRLEKRGVASILAPRILADVCLSEAEEIYTTFPGEILASPFVGLPSMQAALAEYYNAILTKHSRAIKREVDKWVRVVDKTKTDGVYKT